MGATTSADFSFEPRVWSDHSSAYFDKRLVYGAFALRNRTLEAEGTGLTVNFPYYTSVGVAEQVNEDESLTIDNLTDNSFSATIFEVGKAVGVKKRAFYASADAGANIMAEAQMQIGRRHAEFVDDRLNDEITLYNNVPGEIGTTKADYNNLLLGFLGSSSDAEQRMNIRNLHIAKTTGFGDKSEAAIVCFMHPLQWLDSRIDSVAGFLKADANQPYNAVNGFVGQLAGMAIVVTESVKKLPSQIGGRDAYLAHMHKANSYGIINKQDMEFDEDKDILARQWVITGNQWYGVKSFHAKISNDDTKSVGIITAVEHSLA